MKIFFPGLALLALSAFFFGSCVYNKKKTTIIPVDTTTKKWCDSVATVTYAEVEPIFQDENYQCISCHEGGGSGPTFANYNDFKTYIQSNEETFMRAINFENSDDLKNMPQGLDKMPADKITKIKTWICQGMKP